jgi:glutamine cyclotransferase
VLLAACASGGASSATPPTQPPAPAASARPAATLPLAATHPLAAPAAPSVTTQPPSAAPAATKAATPEVSHAPLVTIPPDPNAAAASCLPDDLPTPVESAPASHAPPAAPAATYGYAVRGIYPHDRAAFTEGLAIDAGMLYEGTGLNGQSELRRVDLATGTVLQRCTLPATYFGEGITVAGDKIYQLTYITHTGFVYDKNSFALLQTFSYPTEGWGLTDDGQRLIMSDGTATLRFLDPDTLQQTGQIEVHDDNGPVEQLNELEFVRGEIYANVWQTERLVRIDPQTGQVRAWIDLSGLLAPADRDPPVDVLNGIAYDAERDRLFVTGKFWPKIFEIELVARQAMIK